MANKKSIGLPGGPNEYITHVSEMFSTEGYKRNSPDVNNPYNIIPSSNITMDGVDIPIRGYGNNGMVQDMIPGGGDYNYGNADYVVEIPKAQRGYAVKPKEQTPEEKYYNPEVEENITTGDWKQDFLYNNQWLMDAPLVGDYIKNKARKIAEQSAGERRTEYDVQIALDADSALDQSGDERFTYKGWATTHDHADNKDQASLMDQYFSEEPLFPASEYKPKSDYLEFLPSYSVKARIDADRGGDQGYKDRRDQGLELTIRDAFKKFAGQDGTDNEYTFEDITKSKEFLEFLKNKKTIFMTNGLDKGSYLSDALGLDLGGHKTGVAWDKELNLPYVSISDAWDFSPDHYSEKWSGNEEERQTAKIQASLMHKAGHPFKIYDRFYFDPESQDSKIKYYTDSEIQERKSKTLPNKQNGNGEYKVASGDTFYGIANKNNIPWNALKEANPDLDYENLKLGQQLVLPNKIDRSPPIPKTGVSKNSNVLDYNALSNYLVDTRGGTVDTWGQLADTIAYHESSPWSRMDPKAKQYQGGPGRGLFQFEGESFDTALKRYKNVADAKGFTIKDSIVNAKSADELSSEDQYALFLANLIESKTKLSDFVDGNISSLDVWLTGHKNVEADGDRDSFLESKKAAEKEGIKNGYKTFQYGNGEERYAVAQDNTRVVRPRYNVSPSLDFKKNTALQDFLADANPNQVNDTLINERRVAQDNTAITNNKLNKLTLLPNSEPMSEVDFEKLMQDISEEEKLIDTPYNSPNLTADFIKKSNEYSRGWKDMSEASEKEIKDLQAVLLEKGYNIGKTGEDGVYGPKTYQAHEAMVDDLNLNPTAISRYHKKYSIDTEKEVMGIQQKLVDEGYLSPTLTDRNASSIDGKFGDQTKEALDAYNTANTQEDPQAQVFNFIPSKLDETRCAAGMCTILEGNEVMTEALGVKYKDAWDIFENMDKSENSNTVFNIYDDTAFQNVNSVADLKRVTKEVKKRKQTKASDYKIGDIVGLYWDGSSHHQETLNSKTHNTHSGFVSDVVDGIPIITHNVNGSVLQQPYNELVTGWIKRPNENLEIKSRYNVDGIEDIKVNDLAIQNLAFRYSGSDGKNVEYQGERLKQLENIFKRTKYNSLKIPEILNSSVDPNWLESTVIGITGVETGVGSSVPRSRDDVTTGTLKNVARGVAYDIKGKEDKDISLGIGKTKLASLDPFAKKYFDINTVEDFKDDNKGLDAITYMITKNYELFKDYAKEYPSLGLTETDIRNMSILAYNQGSNRLLKTGRVDDNRSSSEEVKALRELYDATLSDVNSTNYKYIPGVGQQVFDIAQSVGLEKPADSYIKKVNSYRSDLFPESFAVVEENTSPFESSSMAQGGEYGVYNNYIYGKYDGTSREKSAAKLYDKLNVKHYKEAKQEGMTVPNYIISKVIKQTDN
jgi:LysM repeat protein/peptidoglycan hydrolase-like protein with peptidoglycan-binding domain